MTNLTTAITEIKSKVSLQEWQQRIMDCQSSGMSVKAWCQANGISTGAYYFHLRKIRESVLEKIRSYLWLHPNQCHLPKSASNPAVSQSLCRKPYHRNSLLPFCPL